MKFLNYFGLTAFLLSLAMVGCANRFETKAEVKKARPVAPGTSTIATNVAATNQAAQQSGQQSSEVNKCTVSIEVVPSDLNVLVKQIYQLSQYNNLKDLRSHLTEENTEENVLIQGFFFVSDTPQFLQLQLNRKTKAVASQVFHVYDGTADNNYYKDMQVQGQCLTNFCEDYVLVFESISDSSSCAAFNVQLGLYNSLDHDDFSYPFVGESLSFEEIKEQVAN